MNGMLEIYAGTSVAAPFGPIKVVSDIGMSATSTDPRLRVDSNRIDES